MLWVTTNRIRVAGPHRISGAARISLSISATEIPAAVSTLEIARVRIKVWAMQLAAVAVPAWTPWRRAIGGGTVIGRGRRWRRWDHVDFPWCKGAADDCADTEAQQTGAHRVAMACICRCGGR